MDRKWRLDKLLMNEEWEKAEKELEMLEAGLELSCGCNRQYVEEIRYILDCERGRLPIERQYETAREILAITVEGVPEGETVTEWPDMFWDYLFSSQEISVMMKLADTLVMEKKLEQAEFLLKKLLEHYQRSRVKPEFHFRTVILIMSRLSGCSGMLRRHEECFRYSEEGICLCLVSGTRKLLPVFLNNKADALEHLNEKETSLKYYRLAYYSAHLCVCADLSKRICVWRELCGRGGRDNGQYWELCDGYCDKH